MQACCKDETAYSVEIMCLKMRISYNKIDLWSLQHEDLSRMLKECQIACSGNAEEAALTERITIEDYLRFLKANDDMDYFF